MLKRCNTFLFDCDGTLVDSEFLAMRLLCDSLVEEGARRGKEIDPFHVMAMFGTVTGEIIRIVAEKYEVKFPDDLLATVNQRTVELLRNAVEPTKGMAEFLGFAAHQAKQRGGKIAVVTSSGFDRVLPSLERTGLIRHIPREHIFSAVDSLSPPDPKPSPAIYLHACKVLGIEPCEAAAFEDTAGGSTSAERAGIGYRVGYTGGRHITPEMRIGHHAKLKAAGVHRVFSSWKGIRDHFVREWMADGVPAARRIPRAALAL